LERFHCVFYFRSRRWLMEEKLVAVERFVLDFQVGSSQAAAGALVRPSRDVVPIEGNVSHVVDERGDCPGKC
jgi:hypothetical protein